jgi:hypothetical protein
MGDAAAPSLSRHTGGNPLYLLETVKAWLAQDESAATAATPWPVRLPVASSLRALIEHRIGRLSPMAARLARCAAIAAQDFSVEMASSVLGCRTLDLADPWAELERSQVFRGQTFAAANPRVWRNTGRGPASGPGRRKHGRRLPHGRARPPG